MCVSLWDYFLFHLWMTFMCKLCKECENASCCSFESPVFFGQQTMCHGLQTVSEVGGLGVNSKIPRNNTLNKRLPFILPGMMGSSAIQRQLYSSMDHANAIILWRCSILCCWQCISCLETRNTFEDWTLVLVNHLWGDSRIFWLAGQRALWSSH